MAISQRRMAVTLLAAGLAVVTGGRGQSQPVETAAKQGVLRAEFRPSDDVLANPERGFYRPASTDFDALSAAEVAEAYAAGFRLVYARINLERYRDARLSADYLNRLEAAFATARRGGVKLIIRASYNDPEGETEYHDAKDASLARVLEHLAQLKPVFDRNADVIAVMQAGFIGAWGEWHTSSNRLTEAGNRTKIKDALLDAVPSSRFVQFRYPPYIEAWTPVLPGLEAALSGQYRIGFHSDCFLASKTDVGTYSEDPAKRAVEQRYAAALTALAPFGGETCNPADEAGATPRPACSDIAAEGARYHLSYLNSAYYRRLFHENWIKNGCMADVERRMGYRFSLISFTHPANARRGASLPVTLVMRNSGWARLYNPRPVEIVLRQQGTVRRIRAEGADPRRWLPGADSAAAFAVRLPADLAAGTYEVLLALPDADSRLAGDSRYAVRPANGDDAAKSQKWDAKLGAFATGTTLEVR